MKRFTWRLQSVLDVKQKQQELKRAELFDLNEQLNTLQRQLLEQKKILADAIETLAKEDPAQRLERQVFFMTHVKANDEMIRKLESDLQAMTVQRDAKKDEVLELRKLTEGLDKLRAKAQQEFVAEQEKLEQKASDEMTTYRYAHQRMNQDQGEPVKI